MMMRRAGGGRGLREEEAEEAGVLARIVERERGEGGAQGRRGNEGLHREHIPA